MTLLIIGLIATGLVMTIPSSLQLGRDAKQADARLALQRAAITAENRIKFLLLSESVASRGLVVGGPKLAIDGSLIPGIPEGRRLPLIFDGRPYQLNLPGTDDAIVTIQDEAGLINLNVADQAMVSGLLSACGVDRTRAQRLATNLIEHRRAMQRRKPEAGELLQTSQIEDWRPLLSGDRGQGIIATISTAMPEESLKGLVAPKPVLVSIFSGNTGLADNYIKKRETDEIAANLNVKHNHFDYNYYSKAILEGKKTIRLRIRVYFLRTKLTTHLPDYFYQTAIDVNSANFSESLTSQGASFNAGNGAKCGKSGGEDLAPLPLPVAASY